MNTRLRNYTTSITLIFFALGFSVSHAADEPDDIIKFRQNVMKGVGAHINNIAAIAKGKITFTGNLITDAEGIVNGLATTDVLFPPGTEGGKTNALAAIWEDREGFDKALQQSRNRAKDLLQVVKSSTELEQIGKALGALGKSCGGCHKPYRKKM